VGGDHVDRQQVRLHVGDPPEVRTPAERDCGERGGLSLDERQRLKDLERDSRELRRANEILRKAFAFADLRGWVGRQSGPIDGNGFQQLFKGQLTVLREKAERDHGETDFMARQAAE
jgi:hypothetical protein